MGFIGNVIDKIIMFFNKKEKNYLQSMEASLKETINKSFKGMCLDSEVIILRKKLEDLLEEGDVRNLILKSSKLLTEYDFYREDINNDFDTLKKERDLIKKQISLTSNMKIDSSVENSNNSLLIAIFTMVISLVFSGAKDKAGLYGLLIIQGILTVVFVFIIIAHTNIQSKRELYYNKINILNKALENYTDAIDKKIAEVEKLNVISPEEDLNDKEIEELEVVSQGSITININSK